MRKKLRCSIMLAAATGLLVASLAILSSPGESFAGSGLAMERLVANSIGFSGNKFVATDANPTTSPVSVYNQTVKVPIKYNVIYVTLSATGYTYATGGGGGVTPLFVNCKVEGKNCTDMAAPVNDAPAGWVNLQKHDTTLQNNSVYYVWCKRLNADVGVPIGSGTARLVDFEINLATDGTTGNTATLEQIHVFIDGNKIKGGAKRCGDMPAT